MADSKEKQGPSFEKTDRYPGSSHKKTTRFTEQGDPESNEAQGRA